MKGLDINAGFISWVGKIAEEDAHILQILWSAGCVFYVRTTQPQTLMHLETSSNIYGVTTNPYNTTLTCGGSSGGEGALLGFRGSCLGIGTDIGGSIRSPAANNGLYGFKPTTLRLPVAGWSATMFGSEGIIPTIGPLSTSLEGCKLFMKTLIAAKPWLTEPCLLPFPWKDELEPFYPQGKRKLKVGVLWDDGVVKPHPPITRALERVVKHLRTRGNVEVVEWKPYKHDEAWEIIANLYFSDGGAQEMAAMASSHEPWRPLTTHILSPTHNTHVQAHSVPSLWTAIVRRDAYRTAYATYWHEKYGDVDVVLCPAGPSAAPKLDTARYWGYTSQWNLLDYPALVFPVDRVGASERANGMGQQAGAYQPRNEKDAYNWRQWEESHDGTTMQGTGGYENAPVSLQIVGRRYEDEKVLQACELIHQETGCPFVEFADFAARRTESDRIVSCL
ncbi:acetamidase [Phlyctema vagabunda]|uniref:amidase n=1 Tax=Phlyctema vagabunda TaxID=108571 RepID=A0ABR4P2N8_9HELO